MDILLIGNCHSEILNQILSLVLSNAKVTRVDITSYEAEPVDIAPYDFVLLQDHSRLEALIERNKANPRVMTFPNVVFNGYHPDMVPLRKKNGEGNPVRVSAIALYSYLSGLSEEECLALFCEEFIARLNYKSMFPVAKRQLISVLDKNGMCGHYYFDRWHMKAPFMLNPGHPKLFVMVDIALHLCDRMELERSEIDAEMLVVNRGRNGDVFPTYNNENDLGNSIISSTCSYAMKLKTYDARRFIRHCYRLFSQAGDQLVPSDTRFEAFKRALKEHRQAISRQEPTRVNPYANLPPQHFWKNSVAEIGTMRDLTSVYGPTPIIDPGSRVATAGSCFAQHISKTLTSNGLNYYVAEPAPEWMSEAEAQSKRYGMFSARYGNIYTARQLLQLARMAYGRYTPNETEWIGKSGKLLDPFRPNVGDEFDDVASLQASRKVHLDAVRKMLETLDVFVFTLGLTESWINLADGAVYPVAPGVVSLHGSYANYRFKNFTYNEIRDDMVDFLGLLFKVNPEAKVIFTVSPVPLIATYENEHALSATTYSKSVLRAVAQDLAKAFDRTYYFPSYEIITGFYNKGAYYEQDLRNVRQEGVDHVMGVFMSNLVSGKQARGGEKPPDSRNTDEDSMLEEMRENADIVCDENLIVAKG
ncbi:MAG: GSCFA domain-containing protein [Thiobacillus sp.]|nr:GSCFA domain-containing protein [Thiobacillus sp.]